MRRLITTAIALLLTSVPVRAQQPSQMEHVSRFVAIDIGLAVLGRAVGKSQLPPQLEERLRRSVQRAAKVNGSAETQLMRGRRGTVKARLGAARLTLGSFQSIVRRSVAPSDPGTADVLLGMADTIREELRILRNALR